VSDEHKVNAELESSVEQLFERRAHYHRLKFGTESRQRLGPPADSETLPGLARQWGHPLPPSYVAFLKLHEFWLNFVGDASILAFKERATPAIRKQIQSLANVRKEAHESPDRIFVVVAGECSEYFVFLDPSSRRADGEMDVVEYDLELGELRRHADFAAFLDHQLKFWNAKIAEELGKGKAGSPDG
jgi:hypothetical protein